MVHHAEGDGAPPRPHNGAVITAGRQTAYPTRRPPWTTALTLFALIAVPTALGMLALTLLTTASPTGAERATPLMGQGVAQVTEVFDRALIQTPDGSSTLTTSTPATSIPGWSAQGTAAQRATALGQLTGGTVVPSAWVPSRIRTGGRELAVGIYVTDLPPAVTGRFTLVDGRWPTGKGEIAVQEGSTAWGTPGLTLVANDGGDAGPITVVGTVRAVPGTLATTEVLSGDWSLAAGADTQFTILRDRAMDWAEVQDLNAHGLAVTSREVLAHPPAEDQINPALRGAARSAHVDDQPYLPHGLIATALAVLALTGVAHLVWRTKARGRSLPGGYAAIVTVASAVVGVGLGAVAAWVAARVLIGRLPEIAGPFDLRPMTGALTALAAIIGGLLAALWPRVVASGRWVVALLILGIVGGSAGYAVLSTRLESAAAAARAAYVPAGAVGEVTVTWDPEGLSSDAVKAAIDSAHPSSVVQARLIAGGEFFATGSGTDRSQSVVNVVPPNCTPQASVHDPTAVTNEQPQLPCQKVGSTGTLASSSILVLPAAVIAARFDLTAEQAGALAQSAVVLVPGLTRADQVTLMTGTATISGKSGELSVSGVETVDLPAITLEPSRAREVLSLRSGVVLSTELAASLELPTRGDAFFVTPDAAKPLAGQLADLNAALDAIAVGDGSILVEYEPGYVRTDRILRFGLPAAALLGITALGLAAAAVWLARRDRTGSGRGSRRWATVMWALVATFVATALGLAVGFGAAWFLGSRTPPLSLWAVVLCGAALAVAVTTLVSVRSRPSLDSGGSATKGRG